MEDHHTTFGSLDTEKKMLVNSDDDQSTESLHLPQLINVMKSYF